MIRLGLGGMAVLLAVTSLTTSGCYKKHEQEIQALQAQNNELLNRSRDLRTQLAQANTREAELRSQAADKDMELSRRNEEISRLQVTLKEKPAPPPDDRAPTGNWDVGRFADKITVGSDILFASGRTSLTASGKATLEKIARDLRIRYPGLPVRVYGYTDSDPIKRTKNLWTDNLDLSANRAMAVTRYLIGKGIKREKIETVAMGATNFIAGNSSRANKAKNRRVEIVVIK